MKTRILYVEDDESLAFLTKDNLEMLGYEVVHLCNGKNAIEILQKQHFDICLLDVMLPNMDGFQLAREIRKVSMLTPLVFLTAKAMLQDKIEGLEIGADDYITKPFSIKELTLRIEAILRRSCRHENFGKKIGDIVFESSDFRIIIGEKQINLTAKECEILKLFTQNMNQTLTRSDILLQIWGSDEFFLGRSLDVFISRLRKILKPSKNICIENVHGVGFRMVENPIPIRPI